MGEANCLWIFTASIEDLAEHLCFANSVELTLIRDLQGCSSLVYVTIVWIQTSRSATDPDVHISSIKVGDHLLGLTKLGEIIFVTTLLASPAVTVGPI